MSFCPFHYNKGCTMDTQKEVAVFLADFDYQTEQIIRMFKTLEKKAAIMEANPVAPEMVESTAYWLHNLYSAFEDLFRLVAGYWENSVSADGEFHIHVLKRMLVHIEGIRPALLSEDSYRVLSELRGFRHVFRHAYGYGLDEERISFLLRKIMEKKNLLLTDIQTFRSKIEDMA